MTHVRDRRTCVLSLYVVLLGGGEVRVPGDLHHAYVRMFASPCIGERCAGSQGAQGIEGGVGATPSWSCQHRGTQGRAMGFPWYAR